MTDIDEVTMPPALANRSENDEMSIGDDLYLYTFVALHDTLPLKVG